MFSPLPNSIAESSPTLGARYAIKRSEFGEWIWEGVLEADASLRSSRCLPYKSQFGSQIDIDLKRYRSDEYSGAQSFWLGNTSVTLLVFAKGYTRDCKIPAANGIFLR